MQSKAKSRISYSIFVRYVVCLLGILTMAFGITLTVKTNLGTSPLSSIPYVASIKWQPSFGEFSGLYNLCLMVLQIVLLRKNFPKLQYLQLPAAFFFSGFIDIWFSVLPDFAAQSYGIKLIALCAGIISLAFGIVLQIKSNVVMLPPEGFVKALTTATKKDFGTLKVCFDLTNITLGLLLAFVVFNEFRGFGVGTMVSGIFVGVCVKQFQSLHRRFFLARSTGIS